MNHPTQDELLLFAYDELPMPRAATVESHLAGCETCRRELGQLARGRAALDVAVPQRRPGQLMATLAIAAAAVLAGVAIFRSEPPQTPTAWTPTTTWSATAGYVTGGNAMIDIDAQLTRLERGWSYGHP